MCPRARSEVVSTGTGTDTAGHATWRVGYQVRKKHWTQLGQGMGTPWTRQGKKLKKEVNL